MFFLTRYVICVRDESFELFWMSNEINKLASSFWRFLFRIRLSPRLVSGKNYSLLKSKLLEGRFKTTIRSDQILTKLYVILWFPANPGIDVTGQRRDFALPAFRGLRRRGQRRRGDWCGRSVTRDHESVREETAGA